MKLNTTTVGHSTRTTHEGAPAAVLTPAQTLRRTVMACLLWEDTFYEDGQSIAARICDLVPKVDPTLVAAMAVEARSSMKLRHVPLLLCRELARIGKLQSHTLTACIQRADELAEFLAIYSQGRDTTKRLNKLSNQVRKGLARAFTKFNAYELAKYNRTGNGRITLKDVLFLTHPKPLNPEQAATWKKLIDGTLESPDTWEVQLSAGNNKREVFERLILENKLGALALLRNLRNMIQAGVPDPVIRTALTSMKTDRVLPFRFISAARHAPQFEPQLESAMFTAIKSLPKLTGRTALLVDISGSMVNAPVSTKSDIDRLDAACGLAMLCRELGDVSVFTFNTNCTEIPARRGFALRDLIRAKAGGGTDIGLAVSHVNALAKFDRTIVITDEQSATVVGGPRGLGYLINVSADENGIGYGPWTRISGWSESTLDYIITTESSR